MIDWVEIGVTAGLSLALYVIMLVVYRLMGKREMSQLGVFDFVLNLIIANIAANGVTDHENWAESLTGIIILVALQILVAKIQLHLPKSRTPITGEPSLIILDGRIDYGELKRVRIHLDELGMMLRHEGFAHVKDIQYGIIEADGTLSVFNNEDPSDIYPLPLVISGVIKKNALDSLEKSEAWLLGVLAQYGIHELEPIHYLQYSKEALHIHTDEGFEKLKY